jgi:hypothetical protein
MSGGFFREKCDLSECAISDAANVLERIIATNDDTSVDVYGDRKGRGYSPEVIAEIKRTIVLLRECRVRVHATDYLLSGDFGEDNYLDHLNDESYLNHFNKHLESQK